MPARYAGELPADPRATALADWAEAMILVEGRKRLSRSALRSRMRETSVEVVDLAVDLLFNEIDARRSIAPGVYPFEMSETGIVRNEGTDAAIYSLLLWLSLPDAPVRVERRFAEVDELLDKLVLEALVAYVGAGARGVRFGFPASDERPAGFPQAIQWLAGLLGLSSGVGEPSPEVKDGGVDVVVWRPFRDRRSGYLVILGQVTMQTEWHRKVGDVLVRKWHGWIDFGSDPATALAIPFALGADYARWDELRRAVTILLDRMRICELLEGVTIPFITQIHDWVATERLKLAESAAG